MLENQKPTVTKDEGAVCGQVGVGVNYKFRPNLVGHASYDFIWVGGLALAPEQYQFNSTLTPSLDARSTMFLTGGRIGLEYTW